MRQHTDTDALPRRAACAPAWTLRLVSTLVLALGLLPASGSAQDQQLTLNDQGYFAKRGVNVLVFENTYTGVFFDDHLAGMMLIQSGVRTATGGAVRLSPTPEQWDLLPLLLDRKVDKATNTIEVTLRYEAYDFNSRMVVKPEGAGFNVAVFVDKPVPAALEGHAALNMEFRPTEFWEHTYVVDGKPGIFPRYPTGPTESVPEARKIPMYPSGLSGFSTFDLHGHPDYIEALPFAAGKTLLMAPEDPARSVTMHSSLRDLQVFDGRNLAQNGWYVVRSLLATGTTGKVAEWHVEPHTVPNWTRPPNIGFSQVGYLPSQPKRAVIELDPNDKPLPTASLIEVGSDGRQVEKLKVKIQPWGKYLRYNYVVADFSAVKDPGIYLIRYGTQQTGAFPIADDVYERVWHPTLDVYIPVSMDHMFVNEAYRVWHGAAHLDDARQAPLHEQHFDGYRTSDTTNTPYKPGERIPGLAVGGWFDAGDFDMQGGHHGLMVAELANIWETFHPQHDQTLVDQKLRYVAIHQPDGRPDVLEQLEHGALQVAAQFRTIGGLSRGVVDAQMHTYTHLGDASTQTDNLIYDPSLKPYEVRDGRSGTNDDRWVYMPSPPSSSYLGVDGLAAASRSLRGFNDSLAVECLSLAEKAYATARAAPPPPPTQVRPRGFDGGSAASAALQLWLATRKQEYLDQFNGLIWAALDRPVNRVGGFVGFGDQNLTLAAQAVPFMDAAYARKLRPYAERYRASVDSLNKQNPYGVPVGGTGSWGGDNGVVNWATTNYYLHKAYPDLFGTELVTRGLDYLFGTHPYHNYSFVSGVGARPKHVAYGNNRADFTFIAGGIVPGVLVLKPDFPENLDDWPFLWGENEYEIAFSGAYIFLTMAVNDMLAPEAKGTH